VRDGRLVRWVYFKKNSAKEYPGITLIPLGNRSRYIEFEDAVEERSNDKTRMYLR
jgi:hypothetical protein